MSRGAETNDDPVEVLCLLPVSNEVLNLTAESPLSDMAVGGQTEAQLSRQSLPGR